MGKTKEKKEVCMLIHELLEGFDTWEAMGIIEAVKGGLLIEWIKWTQEDDESIKVSRNGK